MTAAAARRRGLLLCLLVVAGCGMGTSSPSLPSGTGAPATAGPAGPVVVTLGLYSGRADPWWTLTEQEVVALDAALAALPRAVGTPPVGSLGYHGFAIARPDGTAVAYEGTVAPPGDGERAYVADPARTIERLLLETARPHVTGNELAEVEKAFAAP